jgi:hypothetical protein
MYKIILLLLAAALGWGCLEIKEWIEGIRNIPIYLKEEDLIPEEKSRRYIGVETAAQCVAKREVLKKYEARLRASGGGAMYDIDHVSYSFEVLCPPVIEDLRVISLDIYESFYEAYNYTETLRPYLGRYPFKSDLSITVRPIDEKGQRYRVESGIYSCYANGYILEYAVEINGYSKKIHQETIEEARAIVEQQQKAAPTSTP